ncbi:MAG: hypothetical protein VB080_00780 [Propionicimonas sp.]|uniref:hypothetical protein n=1 Tax=Propionicimonas sp. TaxID=1955623 RepID=UPI002B211D0C|nr:hypothetical protein [Propionicimonas sp.]MEA4942949.1 hypothetical protein [Propionicimonas sp.]MEA5052259.1 hypothetical protein [Propionicimonas sp.]MEA5119170.1 hypothetical protein [Propionicimonas sp.]
MAENADEVAADRVGRKPVLLRLDPAVHAALARWAADDLRSLNAHIDMLLRQALKAAGRNPTDAGPSPKRGRPAKGPTAAE